MRTAQLSVVSVRKAWIRRRPYGKRRYSNRPPVGSGERKTAELFLRDGLQRLRIRVKLLQAVRDMNERHTGEHEPLVAGSQIFQQVFRFGAHLLQVIGNRRCEIVLPVLPFAASV